MEPFRDAQSKFPPNTILFQDIEALPEVQSKNYDQVRNFSEECELPYRNIRGWTIIRRTSDGWIKRNFDPNKFRFPEGDTGILVGSLMACGKNEKDEDTIPIAIPCVEIEILMDRGKYYRGYWLRAIHQPKAWYRLCEPLTNIEHLSRAVLAAVSLVTETPFSSPKETVNSWLDRKEIYSPEMDLKIFSYLKRPIGGHLLGAKDFDLMGNRSPFLESLERLQRPKQKPTPEQLDAWSAIVEAELKQQPWGERRTYEE